MYIKLYLIQLYLAFILLWLAFVNTQQCAPKKIKIMSNSVILLLFFRYSALTALFFVKNNIYLYWLKSILFLYLPCIPFLAMITYFIFSHQDKIKGKTVGRIAGALLLLYSLLLYFCKVEVVFINAYGYYIQLQKPIYVEVFSLFLYSALIVQGAKLLYKKYTNKLGSIFFMLCAGATIISILFPAIDTKWFFMHITGEVLWIACLNYSIRSLRA